MQPGDLFDGAGRRGIFFLKRGVQQRAFHPHRLLAEQHVALDGDDGQDPRGLALPIEGRLDGHGEHETSITTSNAVMIERNFAKEYFTHRLGNRTRHSRWQWCGEA